MKSRRGFRGFVTASIGDRFVISEARPELLERVGSKITPQPNGCWMFDCVDDYGSVIGEDGVKIPAHRFVWTVLRGELDPDCHLHHKCFTTRCVNPDHLEPLSPSEHSRLHREMNRAS